MRWVYTVVLSCSILVLLLALLGCSEKEAPLPPVPPAPEDLSAWSAPDLVQP